MLFALAFVTLIGASLAMPLALRRAPLRTGRPKMSGTTHRISWACPTLGALGCLEQQEEPIPAVGDGECLVGVRAIGLNYADVFCVLGLYEAANKMLEDSGGGALVPGLEFSGEILAVGNGVSDHAVGDRVYGFCRFGAYRTAVVAPQQLLKRIPDGCSYAEGASLLVQGLTAWHGLVSLGGAKQGSRVLVHSAAGGVGCAALQICDSLGCEAVGVVGTDSKVPFLKERFPSCTPLVRGREGGYAAQLATLGGEYDVVLESLGGKYLSAALERVAPMGRLVHFGATHAYGGGWVDGLLKWLKLVPNYLLRPRIDPGKLVGTNRAVIGFNLIWLTEVSAPRSIVSRCACLPQPKCDCRCCIRWSFLCLPPLRSARRSSPQSWPTCSHAVGSDRGRLRWAANSISPSFPLRSIGYAVANRRARSSSLCNRRRHNRAANDRDIQMAWENDAGTRSPPRMGWLMDGCRPACATIRHGARVRQPLLWVRMAGGVGAATIRRNSEASRASVIGVGRSGAMPSVVC